MIWILPTWVCTVTELVMEMKDSEKSLVNAVVSTIARFAKITSTALMIPSMGYLVKTAELLPHDMVKSINGFLMIFYVAFVLLDTSFNAYLTSIAPSDKITFRVMDNVVTILKIVVMTSSLMIVRMYAAAFVAKCNEVKTARPGNDLIEATEGMLRLYRALRIGLGPALLVAFSLGTLYTISYLYLTTAWTSADNKVDLMNLGKKFKTIFSLNRG